MIGKELLSEVLRMYPQYSGNDYCTGNIHATTYAVHFEVNSNSMTQLNIYELAHMCKEWAFNLSKVYELNSYKTYNGWVFEIDFIKCNTEPESIFKSCQWILDNKDKQ